ncbi:MAG: putative porin, partial [Phycisphaerales bacterium]
KDDVPGSWEWGYDYRQTDADAIVGGFQESDFLGAQTNSKGHRFVFKYQLARNLYWYATYHLLEDTRTSSDLDYRRFLGDLVWKF